MAKRKGRPRQVGEREPSGRLSRAVARLTEAPPPAEVRRLRDAALSGMRDPWWGTTLGVLWARNELTTPQWRAAEAFARLSRRFIAVQGLPRLPGSSFAVLLGDRTGQGGPVNEAAARTITNAYISAHWSLFRAGRAAESVVRRLIAEPEATLSGQHEREALSVGLDALAQHFDLTADVGNGRNRASAPAS
jgi:hypothetical protein